MEHQAPTWFDQFVLYGTLVAAWVFGEGGRVAIAGAAGGFIRWLMDEKRRIIDGAIAVVTGAIFAEYATPVGVPIIAAVLDNVLGIKKTVEDIDYTAGFAIGILGMTIAKLLTALFEKYARKMTSGEK